MRLSLSTGFRMTSLFIALLAGISGRGYVLDGGASMGKDVRCLSGTETDRSIAVAEKTAITVLSKDLKSSRKIMLPEKGRFIQCIAGNLNKLWVGTDAGIFIWDEDRNTWAGPAWKARNIRDIGFRGERVWIVTAGGVWSFGLDMSSPKEHVINGFSPGEVLQSLHLFGDEIGVCGGKDLYVVYGPGEQFYPLDLPDDAGGLTSAAISGSYYAVGTDSGKIILAEKLSGRVTVLPAFRASRAGSYVTVLSAEGRYLWAGSFDGLDIYDVSTKNWVSFDGVLSQTDAVEFIIAGGKSVVIGTESGVRNVTRPYDIFSVIPETTVFLSEEETVTCAVSGLSPEDTDGLLCEFRSASLPDHWRRAEITAIDEKIIWDLTVLQVWDERYELRVTVLNTDGSSRTDSCVFQMDAYEPTVSIDPVIGIKAPGPMTMTGRSSKRYVDSITVDPGRIPARIETGGFRFKAVINLVPGKNIVTAELTDRAGRKASTTIQVHMGRKE